MSADDLEELSASTLAAVQEGIAAGIEEGLRAVSRPSPSHESESDRPGSALSIRGPWGWRLGAHGRVVWLIAVLMAVCFLVWVVTRPRPPTPAPALPASSARAA